MHMLRSMSAFTVFTTASADMTMSPPEFLHGLPGSSPVQPFLPKHLQSQDPTFPQQQQQQQQTFPQQQQQQTFQQTFPQQQQVQQLDPTTQAPPVSQGQQAKPCEKSHYRRFYRRFKNTLDIKNIRLYDCDGDAKDVLSCQLGCQEEPQIGNPTRILMKCINGEVKAEGKVEDLSTCADLGICEQQKKTGPGRASIPSWFFNKETESCEKFDFGGRGGNDNRFKSQEACIEACICKQPKDIGLGKELLPRWFFNQETKKCEEFTFRGKGGNQNNFESGGACDIKCMDICEQPKRTTLGRASIPSWFFNKETESCEKFDFGGGVKNQNNFETEGACEKECMAEMHN